MSEPSGRELIEMYTQMIRIRTFEEKMRALYHHGTIPGTIHLYIGQEAVAVGVCANLAKDDYVISTHRGHGHSIAKGVDPKKIAAEILGKATGCCRGRSGTMHLSDPQMGLLYSSSIVGGGVPIAVGAALSIRFKGTQNVAACFFGDGASNTGGFHEGLNLASVWKLPVVFVCENNLYGLSVSAKTSTSVESISKRASAYNIPGVTADGNDVIAVCKAARSAIKRARRGDGPTLIECKTYRWTGHFAGDIQQPYRPKEEVKEWMKRCPIRRLERKLIVKRILTEEKAGRIREKAKQEVEASVEFAISSPFPSDEDLADFVF